MSKPEFQLLAYHKWLLRDHNKSEKSLAHQIYSDVTNDQNPQAIELLFTANKIDKIESLTIEHFYTAAKFLQLQQQTT